MEFGFKFAVLPGVCDSCAGPVVSSIEQGGCMVYAVAGIRISAVSYLELHIVWGGIIVPE